MRTDGMGGAGVIVMLRGAVAVAAAASVIFTVNEQVCGVVRRPR